jgi:phage terminase large subunit
MLDSLDRIDRFNRKLDRLLPPQAPLPEGPLAWSQATVLTEYANHPAEFFADILHTKLWTKQLDVAKAVLESRRTAVRSGHKIGKSKLAAGLGCWWTCTRGSARGMLTAPTSRQIKKAVWYEVRRYWQNSPELRRLMPEPAIAPDTGCRWYDGRELFGFSATHADDVSGPGGPEVLVIIDEGPGVLREVWEALQGIRAGGGKVLALGNPTQTSGWFFDAFNGRRKGWAHFDIASTETPNYIEGRQVIPGLADRDFVQEVIDDYGIESPQYAVRVAGKFPSTVANAVIGLGLVEGALARWHDEEITDACAVVDFGVDVARFGDDDSAVTGRRGLRTYTPAYFEKEHGIKAVVNGYDAVKLGALVCSCVGVLANPGERIRIKVDVTGGFGEPLCAELERLRQTKGDDGQTLLPEHVEILRINFAGSSSDSSKYPVLRDELWFNGRKSLKDCALYPDPKAESELIAPTYELDAQGRNKVEKKRDTKKRLGRSPDRADSVLLAQYEPPFVAVDDSWVESATSLTRWEPEQRGYG